MPPQGIDNIGQAMRRAGLHAKVLGHHRRSELGEGVFQARDDKLDWNSSRLQR